MASPARSRGLLPVNSICAFGEMIGPNRLFGTARCPSLGDSFGLEFDPKQNYHYARFCGDLSASGYNM